MNILMVGMDLNPPWIEGIRNSVRLISKNLIENGHEVFVLTKGNSKQDKIQTVEGILFHRIPAGNYDSYTGGGFQFLMKFPFSLRKLIKSHDVDIVHVHSVYPIIGIFVGFFSKILGKKVVFTLYSASDKNNKVMGYSSFMNTFLRFSKSKFLTKILKLFVNKIMVISLSSHKKLVNLGFKSENVIFIPLSLDFSVFKPELNKKNLELLKNHMNVPSDKIILLFAGDSAPWKGLKIFVESVIKLKKRNNNVFGIIMEKELYENRKEAMTEILETIQENNMASYFKLIGRCKNIQNLYNISDIILFPYLSFFSLMDVPLSLLEAMAISKPVIVTNLGGFTEIINNKINGMVVPPNDADKIVSSVEILLNDLKLLERISNNARNYMIENYDINIVIKKIETVYITA